MGRQRVLAWGIAGMLALGLCSLEAQAQRTEKVTVALPSIGAAMLPLLVAREQGYFHQAGFLPQLAQMRGAISVKAAVGGSLDYTTDAASSVEAAVRGLKLKMLMVFGEKPLFDLYAQPSVKSFADLRGKAVGVSSLGAASDVMTRQILSHHGLQADQDVTIVATGPGGTRLAALKAGSTAAAILDTPFNFVAQEAGFTKLAYSGDYIRSVFGGLITARARLQEDPDRVYRFVRALLQGHLFYRQRREASLSIMMKVLQLKEQALAARVYDYQLPTLTEDGTISQDVMRQVVEERRRFAKVSQPVDPTEVFDFSLVGRAKAELAQARWRP